MDPLDLDQEQEENKTEHVGYWLVFSCNAVDAAIVLFLGFFCVYFCNFLINLF